jgi:ParB/RepB/Spo0J family partition protein
MSTQTTEPPQTASNGETEKEIVHRLPLDRCLISEQNTRTLPKKTDPGIVELARSIKHTGQTTPGIVREHPKKKGFYEIGAGARRRVAAEVAEKNTFDAVIRKYNDDDFEILILTENLQREDPDPREEVKLLDRLAKRGITTTSAISAHLGKPEHWVARRLKLLDVIPELRKEWERTDDQGLGISHYTVEMLSMLGALPKATQESFLKRNQYKQFENRELDDIGSAAGLRKYLDQEVSCLLSAAPFDLNDPKFFVKGCGPGCASNSTKQAGLFDFGETKKDARCLNCPCFVSRIGKWRKFNVDELRKANGIKKELRFIVDKTYINENRILIGSQEYQLHNRSYDEKILTSQPQKGESEQVIVVDERGEKFHIGYVVKDRTYGGGSSRSKSQKKSLETRKKILQSRRWDIVRKTLIDKVLTSSEDDVTVDVVDLVPIFGFGFNAAPLRTEKYKNKLWARFDVRKKKGFEMPKNKDKINYAICGNYMHDTLDRYSQSGTVLIKDRNQAIWHGLKHVIIDQLLHFRLASEIITDHGVTDIERIGKLLGFDTAKAKKEADLQIPPPKTWGKVDVHTLEPLK